MAKADMQQFDTLYLTYTRGLYKIMGNSVDESDLMSLANGDPGQTNSGSLEYDPGNFGSGTSAQITDVGTGALRSGKTTFSNVDPGYILGFDPKDGKTKFYIGNASAYINWDGSTFTVVGAVSVSSIDIPDTVTANSFHVDNTGNTWWGATTLGSAVAKVLNTGAATFTSVTLSGNVAISGIANSTATDISLLEFSHDVLFSSTDEDTVSWASGTITMSNGRTFSISAGNTGNMASSVLRYIVYLDTAISTTVLQVTTTASSTVGANRIILGTCKKATTAGQKATFVATSGIGGLAIDEAQVFIANLAAIKADMGAITAGTITLNTSGYIKGGQSAYDTGTGFFLGYSGGAYKFSIGVGGSTTNNMTWDGTTLTVNGYAQVGIGTFGGDGSDGALSISSGTTTLDAAGARVLVKNYTSISITGTAKLTISNKHANGTILILKSKGNVTITSSTTPCIDMKGMGGDGGGGVAGASSGNAGTDGFILPYGFTAPDHGDGGGPSAGGPGGTAPYSTYDTTYALYSRMILMACGAGGGSGEAAAGSTSGNAGAGGGVLILECGGALNFTTSGGISVAGNNGSTGSGAGYAGSGGGGGGVALILYRTLTAASGTVTVSGGTGSSGVSNDGGGGGASIKNNGSNGSDNPVSTGGNGGDGVSLVAENKYFA